MFNASNAFNTAVNNIVETKDETAGSGTTREYIGTTQLKEKYPDPSKVQAQVIIIDGFFNLSVGEEDFFPVDIDTVKAYGYTGEDIKNTPYRKDGFWGYVCENTGDDVYPISKDIAPLLGYNYDTMPEK